MSIEDCLYEIIEREDNREQLTINEENNSNCYQSTSNDEYA